MPHRPSRLSKFWQELKRRKVIYVITVYASASFVIIELVNNVTEPLNLPEGLPGIVIVALIVAFPVVAVLSWIFDITSRGVKKTLPVEKQEKDDEVHTSNSWRIATYASIVIIVGLVIFNVVSRNNIELFPDLYGKSIAVLPFINNSPDADNAYFSNGTMEAIHNHLCKIKDLRVISRTSVETYRDNPKSIPSIAEEKKVTYILEGSMQKYGNNIRLTVNLFDAHDRNLWSKLYNREIIQIEDLLTLQSDIAQMVAAEIEAVITPEEKLRLEKVPTRSLMAYDFYQRGLEEQNNAGRASQKKEFLEKAKEYYHLALDNDVTFAKAYSGLASIYWQQQFWLQYFSENSMDSVLILADLALTYDNTLAEAYTLKGRYFNHIGDTSRALEELNKAILFNPNDWQAYLEKSSVVLDYVQKIESLHHAIFRCRDASLQFLLLQLWRTYLDMGFTEEAKHYMQESFTLGKDSAFIYGSLAWYEYALGNYPSAADYMDKCIKLDSAYLEFLGWHEIYINAGQDEKAYQTYKKLLELHKNSMELQIHTTHRIAFAFWKAGNPQEAEHYFNEQIRYCEESITLNRQFAIEKHAHYNLAAVYAFLGDKEKAYKYLEEFEQKDFIEFWEFITIKNDRLFESMRGEERYERFLQTIESKYLAEYERIRKGLEELELLVST